MHESELSFLKKNFNRSRSEFEVAVLNEAFSSFFLLFRIMLFIDCHVYSWTNGGMPSVFGLRDSSAKKKSERTGLQ
ncbi:hypothetical protein MTR_8g032540 [Medicago truncatula]|uniref:Uncharacterized protein n=1 Tax=Medicago truncatula TaxID=3880 RepID=A0A072TN97_MEDTR|nr:hypothetical protein MTR_8g032540 [Medicago truncatula]